MSAVSTRALRAALPTRGAALLSAVLLGACAAPPAPPAPASSVPAVPAGTVKGSAFEHTAASRAGVVAGAQVALPAAPGRPVWLGRWRELPADVGGRYPVVLFLHGSSGLGLAAIGEWQRWLAGQGIASVAPDSFALPDRLTYTSPVDKAVYERIHALRASEIDLGLGALRGAAWVDPARVVLAGTSEGSVAVARHGGEGLAGRILFAWSCEDNYMVTAHQTRVPTAQPVLNVISASDPFFSPGNAYLGQPRALGHCGGTLARHTAATVVLIPGAPHTLLNLPAARHATQGFLRDVLKP